MAHTVIECHGDSECPEFQALLLLCHQESSDMDILHHTSIRKQIIKAWELHFQELKKKLAVCSVCTSHRHPD